MSNLIAMGELRWTSSDLQLCQYHKVLLAYVYVVIVAPLMLYGFMQQTLLL